MTPWVEIAIAFLGFLGSMAGAFSASKLTNYRLEQVEKKVDKHNEQLERLGIIEQRLTQAEKRLDELKEV